MYRIFELIFILICGITLGYLNCIGDIELFFYKNGDYTLKDNEKKPLWHRHIRLRGFILLIVNIVLLGVELVIKMF